MNWKYGEFCVVCGSPYIQKHHIFGGWGRRKISDKYGYVIPLCAEHHTGSRGIHNNRELDLYWKKKSQEHFENNVGTREEFISVFGKSWI